MSSFTYYLQGRSGAIVDQRVATDEELAGFEAGLNDGPAAKKGEFILDLRDHGSGNDEKRWSAVSLWNKAATAAFTEAFIEKGHSEKNGVAVAKAFKSFLRTLKAQYDRQAGTVDKSCPKVMKTSARARQNSRLHSVRLRVLNDCDCVY